MRAWGLFAEQAAGGEGAFSSDRFPFLLIILFALFWLLVLRPMSRRQRDEEQKMRDGLKRGSKVVTSGGIYGTVVSIKDTEDEMVIRSEDTKLRIRKTAVTQVLGSDEAEAGK